MDPTISAIVYWLGISPDTAGALLIVTALGLSCVLATLLTALALKHQAHSSS